MRQSTALFVISSVIMSTGAIACATDTSTQTDEEENVGQVEQDLGVIAACAEHWGYLLTALSPPFEDNSYDHSHAINKGRKAFNDRHLHGLNANGRACADCHVASDDFQLTPAKAKARFEALQKCRQKNPHADDPLFRPIDADDFRTNGDNASNYSNLTENGLIRITFQLPPNVKLLDSSGVPTDETFVDVWRSVPSVNNVALTGPDGQIPPWPRGPNQRGGYQLDARIDTLQNQALAALTNHAQIQNAPPQSFLDNIAAFENSLFTSHRVANLADAIANGTTPLPDPDPVLTPLAQQGKAVFNRACATCHGGNGGTTPFTPPAGFLPNPRYHDIVSACPRPVDAVNPPRFVFKPCSPSLEKNVRTYAFTFTNPDGSTVVNIRRSSDPGRALLTGFVGGNPVLDDFQKLDNANLRGISKTAPYFHNNSAATLDDVLDHYEQFFKRVFTINPVAPLLSTTVPGANDRPFTPAERPALLAYLKTL